MYVVMVLLLLFVAPAGSVYADQHVWHSTLPLMALVGKWFTFWAVGVRLFTAGLRQTIQPRFTARDIFGLQSDDALPIVRELGLANLSMGSLGLVSLMLSIFALPAACGGGLYYGFAGVFHLFRGEKGFNERFAMVTDLLMAGVLLCYAFWCLESSFFVTTPQ